MRQALVSLFAERVDTPRTRQCRRSFWCHETCRTRQARVSVRPTISESAGGVVRADTIGAVIVVAVYLLVVSRHTTT